MLAGDVKLLRRELSFFHSFIALRDGWSGIGIHVVTTFGRTEL